MVHRTSLAGRDSDVSLAPLGNLNHVAETRSTDSPRPVLYSTGSPDVCSRLTLPTRSTMEDTDLQPGQNLAHLLPPSWRAEVQKWFAEDTPSFDWAGFVVGEEEQEAILWGKSGVGVVS